MSRDEIRVDGNGLSVLGDRLVGPLGLRTGSEADLRPPTREEIIDASYPGIFAVHSATPDEVILGNCMGPGGDIARVAALRAGLGHDVPGVTVDRQCGSGLDAVLQAASRVRAGDARLVLAGGAESASTAPHRSWPGSGERYARAPFAPEKAHRLRSIGRVRPSDAEKRANPRARSAVMRVAERTEVPA